MNKTDTLESMTNPLFTLLGILSIAIVSGCAGFGRGLDGCADTSSCASNPPLQIGIHRPAKVHIPSNYTPTRRYPLIVVLHGYGINGAIESAYLGLDKKIDNQQYILVVPEGTANANGVKFWNATPACCAAKAQANDNAGVDYSQVDDVTYIRGLIQEATETYSIDTSRIGLFGHSNGGFLALRMTCEASDIVTSVVSLAGSTYVEPTRCSPATYPVRVLAVHGNADKVLLYSGGTIEGSPYPGAVETAGRFAQLAGCDKDNPVMSDNVDIDGSIAGSETTVLTYRDCAEGVDVELWTIVGGSHIPGPWSASATDRFLDWLIQPEKNP